MFEQNSEYPLEIKGDKGLWYRIEKQIQQRNIYQGNYTNEKGEQKDVAIKLVNKTEYEIEKKLGSKYIVSLYDYSIQDGNYYLVQESCQDQTLRIYINQQFDIEKICKTSGHLERLQRFRSLIELKRKNINEIQKNAIDIISQILAGYLNLIQNNVVHRNLNPENILFNKNWKISSFASSRTILDFKTQTQKTQTGSPDYQSPQQEKQLPSFSSKCDIYAIGIIFFELVFGFVPFTKGQENQSQDYPFMDFDTNHVDENIKQCIIECLKYHENDRIEWEDLFRHQVFKETILFTDKTLSKEIEKIEEYLYPNAAPSNLLHPIVKNKLNLIQSQIRTQKRKNQNFIQWSFFYRTIRNIDPNIPADKISKMFCLIDKESKGQITKSQFNDWVQQGKVQYTFNEIIQNKVLSCILTLERTLVKFSINVQELFDEYGQDQQLDIQGFRSLFHNIDSSIQEDSIIKTFVHLKCNDTKQMIELEMMQMLLKQKIYPKKVQGNQEIPNQNQENIIQESHDQGNENENGRQGFGDQENIYVQEEYSPKSLLFRRGGENLRDNEDNEQTQNQIIYLDLSQ